jgi:hypothetical protein
MDCRSREKEALVRPLDVFANFAHQDKELTATASISFVKQSVGMKDADPCLTSDAVLSWFLDEVARSCLRNA